jgi:acyl-coenzyme A synthetase/AMP-(fatty) acid ligase
MQGAQTTDYKSVRTLLAEQAATFGDKPYMVSIDQNEKALTYDALYRLGNHMAHFFGERGLKPNDRVLMLSENSVEFVAVFLGVQRCGATIATANVEMNRAHIGEILHAVDPVLVLVQEGLGLEELRDPAMAANWIMLGEWNETGGSTGFFDVLSAHPDDYIAEICTPEDIAVIFYTSGTEAKPKGVMQAHSAVWPNYDATADCVELDENSRVIDCRSYTWLSSQNMSLGGPLARGATVYTAKKFSRSRYFDWVRKYKATMAVSVPTILNMFLNEPVDIHGNDIPHLRFFMTSSAPMLPENWTRFEEEYGIRICQSAGCSEGGLMSSHRGADRKNGTIGFPLKYQNIRLLDENDQEVVAGQPGQIVVSGLQKSWGYLHPDGRVEKLPDEHRTGDLGQIDEDGHLTVVGRLKDLIIRGGVNISPTEIDNILSRHPNIVDAAVCGVPHKIYGEKVVCYVVARNGSGLSEETVITHCGETLAPFKTPKQVIFIEELPKSDRGKLDRKALTDAWKRDSTIKAQKLALRRAALVFLFHQPGQQAASLKRRVIHRYVNLRRVGELVDPFLYGFTDRHVLAEHLTDNAQLLSGLWIVKSKIAGVRPKMMCRRRGLRRNGMCVMHRDAVFAIAFEGTSIELRRADIEHDRSRRCVNPAIPAIALAFDIGGFGP